MGWKDMAKIAQGWAEAKKDELLTADRRTRENAAAQSEALERSAQQETVTSALEAVLPPSLAARVTAARPENVAARQAEREDAERVARRERLSAMAAAGTTAELTLTITGDEQGSVTVALPVEREHEQQDPPELSWLRVRLESPDPVPVGSTGLAELAIGVPAYDGPGRYDLSDLYRRGEAGEIGWWEPFDVYLNPTGEADDRVYYVDLMSGPPSVVTVGDDGLDLDLQLTSALGSVRAVGTIRW